MITELGKELDKIYLSYSKILYKLHIQNIRTTKGKEINEIDLRQAISIMDRKHCNCRWKQTKRKDRKCYILIEGYYWLKYVYFQTDKSLIDADVNFFIKRIKQYEKLLGVEPKNLWTEDMNISALPNYFNKAEGTIKHNIRKLNHITKGKYIYNQNKTKKITKEGIEWLCKNCFKEKYLELLENYKMELTERYIKMGYFYDIF